MVGRDYPDSLEKHNNRNSHSNSHKSHFKKWKFPLSRSKTKTRRPSFSRRPSYDGHGADADAVGGKVVGQRKDATAAAAAADNIYKDHRHLPSSVPPSPIHPPTLPRVVHLSDSGSPGEMSGVSGITGIDTINGHGHGHGHYHYGYDGGQQQQQQQQQQKRVMTKPLLPGLDDDDETTNNTGIFEDSKSSSRTPSIQFKSRTKRGAVGWEPTIARGKTYDASMIRADIESEHDDKTTKKNNKKKKDKKSKSSFLSRSKGFHKLSNWAFDVVDTDGSGCVDEKELYSGLLLIHLKLATYAGPAACKPVSRQYVKEIFQKMDTDKSGGLDKEEFREVMIVLCSNVLTRVIIQWAMTLLIVPLIAQYCWNGLVYLNNSALEFWSNLDALEQIREALEHWWDVSEEYVMLHTPDMVKHAVVKVHDWIMLIPESVRKTIPLTILTCILGCLAVPYMLYKLDEYFSDLADRKKHEMVTNGKGGSTAVTTNKK